jgi:hypothetical protein
VCWSHSKLSERFFQLHEEKAKAMETIERKSDMLDLGMMHHLSSASDMNELGTMLKQTP